MNQDILVVLSSKDDPEQFCSILRQHGMTPILTQDIQVAFEILKSHITAFLMLDLSLDGAIPFLQEVVDTFYNPPPYILGIDYFPCSSSQAEVLNFGADVCLEKPIDVEEILAVINAVLRRTERLANPRPLHNLLVSHRGIVLSKEQIYEQVWNEDFRFATTSVSDHISSLRKKLGLNARDNQYIQTVYGAGYRFVE